MKDNFVKIPKDFESLHDLKDFKNQYSAATNFIKKIDEYRESYFYSFIKSYDDVLQYIPENQLKTYHIAILDNDLYRLDKFDIKSLKLDNSMDGVEIINNQARLKKIYETPIKITDKVFLIDTINKKIQFCPWLMNINAPKFSEIINDTMFSLMYAGFKLKVVPAENKFRVAVKLWHKSIVTTEQYKQIRAFGMYYNYRSYDCPNKVGYEIHDFCLRTNRYLGHNKDKSEYYYDYNDGAFEF